MSGARCDTCHGEGTIDRLATPEEVDAGCELGIAFDPCPDCDGSGRVPLDTLLGVIDFDFQAEQGQGRPA